MGGLGNQLFQIFATIAYSFKKKISVIFPYITQLDEKRHSYWDSFLIDLSKNTTKNPEWKLNNNHLTSIPTYRENGFHFHEIPKTNISFQLFGYFQSYKYFIEEQDSIFKLIHLREQQQNILVEFPDFFNDLTNVTYISLHFRLGDYIYLQDHHPILSLEYYKKSIDYILSFLSSFRKIKIVYFCEENDNAIVLEKINKLKFNFREENLEFVKVKDTIPDWKQLLIMSVCHHNIIANSTFSWWGAYFNANPHKLVCYPSSWFGIKKQNYIMNDLFPDNWKKMEC
jgi:hypothetical protein